MKDTPNPVGFGTMSPALVEARNYHAWNYEWIRPYIRGRILDVGGGTGNHLAYLNDHELVSIDISSECIGYLKKKYSALPHWKFVQADICDPSVIGLFGEFDTVLSCNVFEHIPNDEQAFVHSARLLKKGGKMVLLLPAHQALFGAVDRLAGHYRRYNRKKVKKHFQQAGLIPETIRYVNLLGAVGWFINSKIGCYRNISSPVLGSQIRIFDRFIVPLMKWLEGTRNMPFGQSVVCVGRKE